MPDITQQSSTLQIETLTSSSTFWGGLSGSLQLVNSGELMVEPWTFSFRSKYSDFDFYQADETAVLNEDGSYTITISAPSGSAGLAVGDSLSLNFTVNSASDPDVTLAEVVLSDFSTEAGDNSTDAGDNSTDTSTGNETSADEPTGETTGGDSGTDGELSNSASGASVSVELGSSWQGAYEGTITVSNKGSDPIAAGWSVSFISAHQLSNISDFQVDQVARDDGRFTVTLSAPSWNTNQVLAAGTRLSSYFQASGELNGKTIEQLFEITADSSTDTSPDFASDSTGDSISDSTSDSTSDSAGDSIGDSTVDSSTDAVPDSETDSSTDPLTDSGVDASTDSTGDSISDSTGDTSGDSTVDTGSDTATDPSPDPSSGSGSSSDPMRVVAYFEEWGIYGRDFRVADINADELTHINYSFFGITPTEEDMPSMSSDLNVLPGGWVQDNYQGMNSNVPGELGIHDPWAAYEKTFSQPDQLVSRTFSRQDWDSLSQEQQAIYTEGGNFVLSSSSAGSVVVTARADTYLDSQGGIRRTFTAQDWQALSEERKTYLVDNQADYTWTDQWQGNFNAAGSTSAEKIASVDAHFAAGAGRSLSLTADGDLFLDDNAWSGADKDAWEKLYAGNLNQLRRLSELNPDLNIGFAIGGWTLSGNFSTNLDDAAGRESFTDSIIDHLEYYDFFNTVDFDWEYPGGGGLSSNAVSNQDGRNFQLTLEMLDNKLDALEAETGRSIEISIATAGGAEKLANLNLEGIDPHVDFYNVMTYDFHGGWESQTGHQAAMTGDAGGYDVVTAIQQFENAGVAMDKVVLGAPAYTRAWGNVAAGDSFGYQQNGDATAAPGSFEKGNYDYNDLITGVESGSYDLIWDDHAKAAFAYNESTGIWSSIETTATIAGKAAYIEEKGLGGMMFWALSNDATGEQSLITAAHDLLLGGSSYSEVADRAPEFDQIMGGDGIFSMSDFTDLI